MTGKEFLKIAKHSGLKCKVTAAAVVAASVLFSPAAQAGEIRKAKEQVRSVYLVKYWVGNNVRYNKNPASRAAKVSASQYRASNPYVCTPSGFGQKARCYVPSLFKKPNV